MARGSRPQRSAQVVQRRADDRDVDVVPVDEGRQDVADERDGRPPLQDRPDYHAGLRLPRDEDPEPGSCVEDVEAGQERLLCGGVAGHGGGRGVDGGCPEQGNIDGPSAHRVAERPVHSQCSVRPRRRRSGPAAEARPRGTRRCRPRTRPRHAAEGRGSSAGGIGSRPVKARRGVDGIDQAGRWPRGASLASRGSCRSMTHEHFLGGSPMAIGAPTTPGTAARAARGCRPTLPGRVEDHRSGLGREVQGQIPLGPPRGRHLLRRVVEQHPEAWADHVDGDPLSRAVVGARAEPLGHQDRCERLSVAGSIRRHGVGYCTSNQPIPVRIQPPLASIHRGAGWVDRVVTAEMPCWWAVWGLRRLHTSDPEGHLRDATVPYPGRAVCGVR